VDVHPAGLYELSFWYLTNGQGPFDLIVTALQCCAVNSFSSLFNATVDTTVYTEVSVTVSLVSDSTLIEFSAASSTLGVLLFIDDVSLTRVTRGRSVPGPVAGAGLPGLILASGGRRSPETSGTARPRPFRHPGEPDHRRCLMVLTVCLRVR
jgi:hypothetical protein